MIQINNLLTIKYFNGSTYTNMSMKLGQVIVEDSETITLDTDNYLYIGYEKPIKQIYVDLITPNTNASSLTYEYYNGTEWIEITKYDNSMDLTRSGFAMWNELEDSESIEIDGDDLHHIRISTDSIHTESEYNFIGLLFSDDRDLQLENPYILEDNMLMGESNHLKAHVASRDYIVQSITNRYKKNNKDTITGWDLLRIEEVKQAAMFLTLSKIYFNLSDAVDDSWAVKSDVYSEKYQEQYDLVTLSFDQDDDGIEDNNEIDLSSTSRRIIR